MNREAGGIGATDDGVATESAALESAAATVVTAVEPSFTVTAAEEPPPFETIAGAPSGSSICARTPVPLPSAPSLTQVTTTRPPARVTRSGADWEPAVIVLTTYSAPTFAPLESNCCAFTSTTFPPAAILEWVQATMKPPSGKAVTTGLCRIVPSGSLRISSVSALTCSSPPTRSPEAP